MLNIPERKYQNSRSHHRQANSTRKHCTDWYALLNDARPSNIIADIYPFVGHPSQLGRQDASPNAMQIMRQQAKNMLNLDLKAIVASGEAARLAFTLAILEGIICYCSAFIACLLILSQRKWRK